MTVNQVGEQRMLTGQHRDLCRIGNDQRVIIDRKGGHPHPRDNRFFAVKLMPQALEPAAVEQAAGWPLPLCQRAQSLKCGHAPSPPQIWRSTASSSNRVMSSTIRPPRSR